MNEVQMTTVVFEDTHGEQVLVTVHTNGGQRIMTIATRPERDAIWGPPLRPVLVDGSKPDVNMKNPWSQDVTESLPVHGRRRDDDDAPSDD